MNDIRGEGPGNSGPAMIFRVVEDSTGEPLSQAEVRLPHLDPPQEYKTDQDGICRISLGNPQPNSLGVYVQKSGFVPMRVVWNLSATSSRFPSDYTLRLEPAQRIGGQVRNESGRPIGGVTVFLVINGVAATKVNENVRADIFDRTCVTDAEGRWHFDEAPSEFSSLLFRLKHPNFVEEVHYSKADTPLESFVDGTAIWTLKKGVRVEGIVVDREGLPVANAEILPGRDRVCSGLKPSFRTDVAGKFSIPLSPEPHASLTVKAEGRAPALLEFPVTVGMGPLRIPLEPGRKIRGRVVNAVGEPLAGALVFADTWRQHRTLEWQTRTDEDGRFEWDSAPPDEVLFDILQSGYRPARRVSLRGSEEEQTVVLHKPLVVRGTVSDSETRKPIDTFHVVPGWFRENQRIYWAHDRGAAFSGGTYEWTFNDTLPGAKLVLRIEAEGYRTAVSQIPDSGETADLDFRLKPGAAAIGRVLNPDGTPAAKATVVIVSGNPAILNKGKLEAGHGNLALLASEEGSFSLPLQEPPYAVVAVNESGCAIVTAEEFARDSVLQLKPWGRLEVKVDGAGVADGQIPFYISYPDLPKDARGMPWVSVQPMAERISGDRILFDKLLAGKAWLGRYGQSNRDPVALVIKGSETIRLDFDRGIANGERVRGTVAVKVIDESGNPVEGAVVTPQGFRLKRQSPFEGCSVQFASQHPGLATDSRGVALVNYPTQVMNHGEVEIVSIKVRHPDFCPAQSDLPVSGEALPVVLKRGATVRLSGFFEENGHVADRVYVQILSPDRGEEIDPDAWNPEDGGTLLNPQVPAGKKYLRLASFPTEGEASFSDAEEVTPQGRQTTELRMALRPGLRFTGKLDEHVPRPVSNGRVDANILTDIEGSQEPFQWQTWTRVEPDGSFVFESVPPGRIELTAICDGFCSAMPAAGQSQSARVPQTFHVTNSQPFTIPMEPTAAVLLDVRDEEGKPLPGVRVHFYPHVVWAARFGGVFAGTLLTTEEMLRLDLESRKKRLHDAAMTPRFQGTTGQDGLLTITNLPSGKQRFRVDCEGYGMELLATNHPISSLREITLSAGEIRKESVVMHKKASQ